jgi:uncharacterized protein
MDRPTYIHHACCEGNVKALQRLFPDGPTNEWLTPSGVTLLHWVVRTPHLHVLEWILLFPVDVNVRMVCGTTPLMVACFDLQEDMARQLLAHGSRVNETTVNGTAALHFVCIAGWSRGLALLLEHGADVHQKTRLGNTALHLACLEGWIEGMQCLLDWGAHSTFRNQEGRLPEDLLPFFVSFIGKHEWVLSLLHAEQPLGCGLK